MAKSRVVRDAGGARHAGRNAREIVRAMHADAWMRSATDEDFMVECAKRAEMSTGRSVRYDTAENFIADLIAVGLLSEVGQ